MKLCICVCVLVVEKYGIGIYIIDYVCDWFI